MLKTILRIVVILLVVSAIAGGLYWIVQRNPSALGIGNSNGRGVEQHEAGERNLQGFTDGGNRSRGAFGRHSREYGDAEGIGRGTLGILRNLGFIALITLAVLGIQKVLAIIKRRKQTAATTGSEG